MDKILYPHMRKWISNPVNLGEAIQKLREQVQEMDQLASSAAFEAAQVQQKRINPGGSGGMYVKQKQTTLKSPSVKSNVPVAGPSKLPDDESLPSTSKAAKKEQTKPGTGTSNFKDIKSSGSKRKDGIVRLMSPDDQQRMKESAERIAALLGDKFFDVKTNDRKKKKKKGDEPSDGEQAEENLEEANVTVGIAENRNGIDDSEDSDGPGYRPPSVKDYFSDFSNLSDESDEEYVDDFVDINFKGRQRMYGDRLNRYSQQSSDDEDSDNEKGEDVESSEEDAGEQSQKPHEPNEKTDDTKGKHSFGPTPTKRGKLAKDANVPNESGENVEAEDKSADVEPTSGLKADVEPQSHTKKIGGDEQFKPFMDRVFKRKKQRDATFQDDKKSEIMKMMGISEDRFKELRSKMNIRRVSVKGETFQEEPIVDSSVMPVLVPPLPESAKSQLQSLAIFVTHGDDPTGFQSRSNNVQQQIDDDILNVAFQEQMEQQEKDYADVNKLIDLVDKAVDFLIEISVYQAGDPDETLPEDVKSYAESKLAYKLELLGRQTVAELRDAMHCENDLMSVNEVQHPDCYHENPEELAKNIYPTAALIIGDTIYSDMRKPDCINFADMINKWAAASPAKKIGPFSKGDMVSTKLQDLTVRFGYPYMYTHMGNCEHIVVFNKARLLEKKDEHRLSHYPKVIPSQTFKSIHCRVDNEYLAKWAVLDYAEFPEDPMMVCTECLKSYCYDAKGKKRGDFRVFPFRQLANEL